MENETKQHRPINDIWNELKNHPDYVFGELWDKGGIKHHLVEGANGYLGEHFTDKDLDNIIENTLEETKKDIIWCLTNNYNYINPIQVAQEQLDTLIETNFPD